jgi:Tol biopolymer transport system component
VHRPREDQGALTDVTVIDAEGSVIFKVEAASSPAWSPSGERLALQRPNEQAPASGYSRQEFPPRIEVYDKAGSLALGVTDAINAEWSPDETELTVLRVPQRAGSPESTVTKGYPAIVDLGTGDERPLSAEIEEHDLVYPTAWHPAGDVIAYRDAVYDRRTGEEKALPGVPVFWSPDGRLLFMTFDFKPDFEATTGQLWDLQQGRPIIGLDIRNADAVEPAWQFIQRWVAWTPDGRYLMYLDPRPGRYVFRLFDTVSIQQQRFSNIKGEAPSPSPDGTHVVFMDEGNIWVFVLAGTAIQDIADGTFPAWRPEP